MKETIVALFLVVGVSSIAQEPVQKAETTKIVVDTAVGAMQSPVAGVANLTAGLISSGIKQSIMKSAWLEGKVQEKSAKMISEYLSKRNKETWTLTNHKVEDRIILAFEAKSVTKEVADALIKEEPLAKWKKLGWNYLLFTNGVDSWLYPTESK